MDNISSSLPLAELEPYIDRLILTCHELHRENKLLREKLQRLEFEKSQLSSQNREVADQIRQVIHQLQEEIHERSA